MHFLDSVHAKTIIQSKKGGKKYFHQIGYAIGQNLAKFEALKACEAEWKTSMHFLDDGLACTESKKSIEVFDSASQALRASNFARFWPRS